MDPGTFDFNTLTLLVAIMGSTMGSTLTLITLMVRQSNRHDASILSVNLVSSASILSVNLVPSASILSVNLVSSDKIDALGTKFTDKIDALDTKFTDKIDALGTKFTDKIDVMGGGVSDARERLARIEGHLMAPGGLHG